MTDHHDEHRHDRALRLGSRLARTRPVRSGTAPLWSVVNVSLRRAHPDDAERVLAWRREPSAGRYQPLQCRDLATMRAALAKRARDAVDPHLDKQVQWIVEAGTEPVGWVTLMVTSRDHATGTLGYTIGETYRGHGYASAAVREAIAVAFASDGANLERLEAVAAVANRGSRRVLEKAGFHLEGIARGLLVIQSVRVDHARYALLRSEWNAVMSGQEQGLPG